MVMQAKIPIPFLIHSKMATWKKYHV